MADDRRIHRPNDEIIRRLERIECRLADLFELGMFLVRLAIELDPVAFDAANEQRKKARQEDKK
jgi:hypothetical protein